MLYIIFIDIFSIVNKKNLFFVTAKSSSLHASQTSVRVSHLSQFRTRQGAQGSQDRRNLLRRVSHTDSKDLNELKKFTFLYIRLRKIQRKDGKRKELK